MNRIGCLFGLLVGLVCMGALAGEVVFFIWLARRLDGEYFGLALAIVGMSALGVRLAAYHASRIPMDLLTGRASRRFTQLMGAILLAFPGLITGALGLLLQVPLVAALLTAPGGWLFKRLLSRFSPGLGAQGGMMGGMMGGMKGGPFGSPFPGMTPDHVQYRPGPGMGRRGPKEGPIIDTTVERD